MFISTQFYKTSPKPLFQVVPKFKFSCTLNLTRTYNRATTIAIQCYNCWDLQWYQVRGVTKHCSHQDTETCMILYHWNHTTHNEIYFMNLAYLYMDLTLSGLLYFQTISRLLPVLNWQYRDVTGRLLSFPSKRSVSLTLPFPLLDSWATISFCISL